MKIPQGWYATNEGNLAHLKLWVKQAARNWYKHLTTCLKVCCQQMTFVYSFNMIVYLSQSRLIEHMNKDFSFGDFSKGKAISIWHIFLLITASICLTI